MERTRPTLSLWQRALRQMAGLLARPGRDTAARAAPLGDADWAARSAVGEEDPGASVDLLDTRPPSPEAIRAGGPPRG
ncbi:MAG: hypothetical protein ABS53_10650 [Hydrogenophaga sp. SCN 70-13]|uniref:hypothetical protein n=2 Tax=unclassified Hydrogenophaga TaxID=2610897 RepID=UPI00086BFBFC|nr:hypothetical protein [Hydrogenophaga sp.]ODT31438.1 MAG: hypothetical protein ABS53_10650 [Hydrogenophaga sp. SCN 70-13]OJV53985.1 MAG: hypothetical protein BGO22_13035 [Hydrogenophaga sp. 70-12]